MFGETGSQLDILITSETGKDWQTFCTWYSINRMLPDANVVISCQRNNQAPFQYFQWTKRLKIPTFRTNPFNDDTNCNKLHNAYIAQENKLLGEHVLIIDPLVVVIEPLDESIMEKFSNSTEWTSDGAWYFKQCQFRDRLDDYMLTNKLINYSEDPLCFEAKTSEESHPIVSFKKGCGKWIDTLRGCPFSNAAGLVAPVMTVNENKIIELWKRMVSLYSAII